MPVRGSDAIPNGARPTLIRATTCPLASLIIATVSSRLGRLNGPRQVTQTVPVFWSAVTPTGLTHTLIVATTARRASLISDTVPSRLLTTQTVPVC